MALKISASEMSFETLGTMNTENGCVALEFEIDASRFVLSAYDGHISVIRYGEPSYELEIAEGVRTRFIAGTEAGNFQVQIDGLRVSVKIGATTELLVKYLLGIAGGSSEMLVHIKAVPQGGN